MGPKADVTKTVLVTTPIKPGQVTIRKATGWTVLDDGSLIVKGETETLAHFRDWSYVQVAPGQPPLCDCLRPPFEVVIRVNPHN